MVFHNLARRSGLGGKYNHLRPIYPKLWGEFISPWVNNCKSEGTCWLRDIEDLFRLQWISALVGQKIQPQEKAIYLRQQLVWQTRWKVNQFFKMLSTWSSLETKFLVRGFEVAQETWSLENSLTKSVITLVAVLSFFYPYLKFPIAKVVNRV